MVFGYLDTPRESRLSLPRFLKKHRMTKPTFFKFEGEHRIEKLGLTKREKEVHLAELTLMVNEAFDKQEVELGGKPAISHKKTSKWLHAQGETVNEALIGACRQGNAQALKLFFQLTDQLVEKQDIKVGLSADEIAKRNLEADNQLKEEGY